VRKPAKVIAACLFLGGCGIPAHQLPFAPTAQTGIRPALNPQSNSGLTTRNNASARMARGSDTRGSWMMPDAATQDLLYVSSYSWVSVYTYPQGNLVGKLRGFYLASGQCVDSKSNIYITDYATSRVYEYAHGSRTRMRTIYVPGAHDCSIDPTTGELAVISSGVWIYNFAKRQVRKYKDSHFYEYWYCGYDPKGNLFIDGLSRPGTGNFVFAELPKGGSQLQIVTLNQYIGWPGPIKWHYQYLAVGDLSTPVIYQFVIKGRNGTRVGTTHLGSNAFSVKQFWIQGQTVVTSTDCDENCSKKGRGSEVMLFKYPAGGNATKTITAGLKGAPDGDSVSLVPG
jgi:hypothetical protein